MKPETTQTLRQVLAVTEAAHADVSELLQAELAAIKGGKPTPTHAKGGRNMHDLIVDEKKDIALRGVLATVALEGREATKFGLTIAHCFNRNSQAVRCAHQVLLANVFPGLPLSALVDLEQDLEAKGVHFKARRIRALVKPKA